MKSKKLTTAALFVAIGVTSSHLIYIPVGIAKAFPVQHCINLLAAILFGPQYAALIAFIISLLRNILGTGSLFAFPGSIIGAALSGIMFKLSEKPLWALGGEVIGTGILGSLISYPIAKYIMGTELAAFFFVIPFLLSSIAGALMGFLIYGLLFKHKLGPGN